MHPNNKPSPLSPAPRLYQSDLLGQCEPWARLGKLMVEGKVKSATEELITLMANDYQQLSFKLLLTRGMVFLSMKDANFYYFITVETYKEGMSASTGHRAFNVGIFVGCRRVKIYYSD